VNIAFDPAAAAVINVSGKASISGQAFVRRNNGKLLRATAPTSTSSRVLLMPTSG
jgi:hypothetical protein